MPRLTLAAYRSRLKVAFAGADLRVLCAFWLFGLINNVLYVIILSAALDLVGVDVPKGVVLLADVAPSFLMKLLAPSLNLHKVPYPLRILVMVALSTGGMLLIAMTPDAKDGRTVAAKMSGVAIASLSSGGGEFSFLGLTHFYGHFSLAAWGSGTGGAGLIGAAAYVVATTWLGWSVKASLLVFSVLPVVMLVSFFVVLPRGPLKPGSKVIYEELPSDDIDESFAGRPFEGIGSENPGPSEDGEGLLASSLHSISGRSFTSMSATQSRTLRTRLKYAWGVVKGNLRRSRGLFIPYMVPLLLVYIAEYTINQGVAPTLLFPLSSTPFSSYREFYPTYNAIYQTGVFISRSSTPFIRIHALYIPSLLQCANLALLTAHAIFNFIPSVYIVFVVMFWEGLLGGLVYMSTFAEITDNVPQEDREFSLGATSVSDSGGICIAGFLGMALETLLCRYQVHHGRDFCKK
ncbi:MAG: battenin CLN3 protein [Geoglossum umbratile]|nr:MAG: battenin CLN3 protein [Geoglossum umbratile]